ncbi:hypothetical protein B6254_1325 [Weissella cibaria]|uniref:Uncharacterized protein n=1 Tax=Weissella cibaria TaxID=137591 RepID=A0A2S1KRU3_9LACO|nr:hypothetical protein B6254_1325 [Weissella cibaria]
MKGGLADNVCSRRANIDVSVWWLLVGFVDVRRQSQQQEVKTQKTAQTLNGWRFNIY